MTWTTFHRRAEVLRDVMAAVDADRDGLLPMALPGVREAFRDELDLLGALQFFWHTRLAGEIERELMLQPHDPEGAAAAAWRSAVDALPGVRAVLDHYAGHPLDARMAQATATATRKERDLLGRVPHAAA